MWSKVQEFLKKDMVYNREGHNEKKTEEIFYSIKYYYMDMPAVTVSTRKSAKVKQSRYTPVSDLPSALAIRTDSDECCYLH